MITRCPRAEREWLDDAGVRLIVPMIGTERHLAGLLMLGDKKSDEPYSSDDREAAAGDRATDCGRA